MKRAYVTLICGGESYEPGVETLGRSLRASGTREPMPLLATPEVPAATLDRLADVAGWEPRRVEPIANPAPAGDQLYPRFGNTYTKLRAFGLADVEKAVFLDADTLGPAERRRALRRPRLRRGASTSSCPTASTPA